MHIIRDCLLFFRELQTRQRRNESVCSGKCLPAASLISSGTPVAFLLDFPTTWYFSTTSWKPSPSAMICDDVLRFHELTHETKQHEIPAKSLSFQDVRSHAERMHWRLLSQPKSRICVTTISSTCCLRSTMNDNDRICRHHPFAWCIPESALK